MKRLSILRAQLAAGEFEFTQHALKRVVERNIAHSEIREAGAHAVIIEDYPSDKYGPSCLLLGVTDCQSPASYPGGPQARSPDQDHHPV